MQEAQEFDFPPLDTPSAQGRANSSAGGMNLRNDTASDTYKSKGRNSGTAFQNRALQDKMTYLVKLKTTETAKGQRRVKSTAPPPHTLFSLGLFFLPSLDPRLLSTFHMPGSKESEPASQGCTSMASDYLPRSRLPAGVHSGGHAVPNHRWSPLPSSPGLVG